MRLPVEGEALGRRLCALISLHSPLQRQEALLVEDHRQGPDFVFMQFKLLGLPHRGRGLGLFPEDGESSKGIFFFHLALAI